ncbi:hypothetical protein A2U01_0100641, partial [Trifolium medium]|nr:hypothetical protein [Trifolium medium]
MKDIIILIVPGDQMRRVVSEPSLSSNKSPEGGVVPADTPMLKSEIGKH